MSESARPCSFDLTRSPATGTRLDQQTWGTLLSLQDRLLALLDPPGPEHVSSIGWLQTPAQYFTDLRALTWLILLSWPAAEAHTDTAAQADLLSQAARNADIAEQQQRQRPGKRHPSRAYSDPPLDPLAAGALLRIAEKLLDTSEEEIFHVLQPMLHRASAKDRAMTQHLRQARHVSEPLRLALTRTTEHTWQKGMKYLAGEQLSGLG